MKRKITQLLGRGERTGAKAPTATGRSTTVRIESDRFVLPVAPSSDVTGQTIFGDVPLRFRNLTLSPADIMTLANAANIEGVFKIRVAKRAGTRREAGVLVGRRYSGRGYRVPVAPEDPHVLTFLAYDEGVVVGTVSVRLDSPKGLSADELYGSELAALRKQNFRVCEFTRLAVNENAVSKPVLAGLFHTGYLYAAVVRGFTHAVIEVNPRHVSYYSRALKFETLGVERINTRVNAPGVLLCVAFSTIAEGIARFAGHPDAPGAGRSLFPYAFLPSDEPGVTNRLRQLVENNAKR